MITHIQANVLSFSKDIKIQTIQELIGEEITKDVRTPFPCVPAEKGTAYVKLSQSQYTCICLPYELY